MPNRRRVPPLLLLNITGPTTQGRGCCTAIIKKDYPVGRVGNFHSFFNHLRTHIVPVLTIHSIRHRVRSQDFFVRARANDLWDGWALVNFQDLDVRPQGPVQDSISFLVYSHTGAPISEYPGSLILMYAVLPGIAVDEIVIVLIGIHNPGKGLLLEIAQTGGTLALFPGPI